MFLFASQRLLCTKCVGMSVCACLQCTQTAAGQAESSLSNESMMTVPSFRLNASRQLYSQ